MVITLYWWMLPAAILMAGVVCLLWPRESSGGYIDLSGLVGVMGFVASAVIALSICLGHWL